MSVSALGQTLEVQLHRNKRRNGGLQQKHDGWLKSRMHAQEHVEWRSTYVTCALSSNAELRNCMLSHPSTRGYPEAARWRRLC